MHGIVVAFGVAKTTRKAVQRLLRLTGLIESVTVVPAAPHVAVGEGMIPGAEISTSTGSDGVRRVAGTANGPVLLVHDDVLVTRSALKAMASCLSERGGVIAPYSNESAPHQFIGPFPPVDHATAEVEASRRALSTHRVHEARFSCLVLAADLVSDVGGSLVMPGSALIKSDVPITLAPAAVAHDMACGRLGPPSSDAPLLVASMIVRDEESMLPGALESIHGLVDRIEICDTGSEDATIAVAEAAGASVTEIEWRDDFAWARNQALEQCRDATFALLFDADERIRVDDPAGFRQWLATWAHEIDGLSVEVASERDGGGQGSAVFSIRLARAEEAFFEGAIHEILRIPVRDRETPNILQHRGVSVVHHGYRSEIVSDKAKADRNIRIARTAFEKDPSIKSRLDLARSLRMVDVDDPEAEALFRAVLEELSDDVAPKARSFVRAVVGAYEMNAGNVDRALELSNLAVEDTSGEDVAILTIGYCLTAAGRSAELVEFDAARKGRAHETPMFAVQRNVHRYEVLVARALFEAGRLDEGYRRLVAALEADPAAVGGLVGDAIQPVLAESLDDAALLRLLSADPSGSCLHAISRSLPPTRTAQLCIGALQLGVGFEHLVLTGLTAALVKGVDPLVELALDHIDLVGSGHLVSLADLARRKGREDVAHLLGERALGASPGFVDPLAVAS